MHKKLKCSSSQMAYLQKARVIFLFFKEFKPCGTSSPCDFFSRYETFFAFYLCLPLWIHDKFVVIMNHATSSEQK